MPGEALSSLAFFRLMHGLHEQAIAHFKGRSFLLDAMLALAWGSCDAHVQCH